MKWKAYCRLAKYWSMKGILPSGKILVYERHTAVWQNTGLWKAYCCPTKYWSMKGILLSGKVLVYERHTAVWQSIGLWKAWWKNYFKCFSESCLTIFSYIT
jgi:hypothetical protein